MRTLLGALALCLLLTGVLGVVAGDAGDDEAPATEAADLTAAELGRLGAELDQEPERAEEILDEAGLTWEQFEAAVREVSADTEEARRYAEAFAAAGGEVADDAGGEETAPPS